MGRSPARRQLRSTQNERADLDFIDPRLDRISDGVGIASCPCEVVRPSIESKTSSAPAPQPKFSPYFPTAPFELETIILPSLRERKSESGLFEDASIAPLLRCGL